MDFFELQLISNLFISLFTLSNADWSPFTYLWVSLLICGLLYIVVFALEGIALCTIAKREGYKHRWMAFVPFFNTYYIGVVSDKNRFYNIPAKALSAALAAFEAVLVAGMIFATCVDGIVYAGNLYEVVTATDPITGVQYIEGYQSSAAIAGTWLAWVFDYFSGYVLTWFNLAYIALHVLVVICFFQTYACRRYVLFTLGAVLFPIKGILMIAVRNNRGISYRDYMRGEQRRRYEMYQQYSNQSGNPYGGYNPYGGRPTPPPSDDPYGAPRSSGPAADPFDGLGENSSSAQTPSGGASGGKAQGGEPDDPFDEFK